MLILLLIKILITKLKTLNLIIPSFLFEKLIYNYYKPIQFNFQVLFINKVHIN
jgi:hypothetical protein